MAYQILHLPQVIAGQIETVQTVLDLPPADTVPIGSVRVDEQYGNLFLDLGTTWYNITGSIAAAVTFVNGQTGVVMLTTADIPEVTNLYFTNARAQDAVGGILTNTSTISFTYTSHTSIAANIVANSITNSLISPTAAIAYSKLALSNSIVNSDINTTAAIARSKLAALTANQAMITDASGFDTTSVTTATELSYVHGVTSPIQTQINSITGSGITSLTGDVTGTGPGAAVTTISNLAVTNAKIANATIDLTTKVTNKLPIANGGTNSSTALNNNRVMQSSGGAIVEAAAITANRALISDANGIPTQSVTTNTELGYVSGVTSAIQTQLNGKQATGNYITALTGDITATGPGSVAATIANLAVTNAKIANSTIDLTTKVSVSGASANQIPVVSGSAIAYKDPDKAIRTTQSISSNVVLSDDNRDIICLVDTSAARTITLPAAANNNGRRFTIKDTTGSEETNNITLIPNGTDKIEGINANKVLSANWGSVILFCDGTQYYVI